MARPRSTIYKGENALTSKVVGCSASKMLLERLDICVQKLRLSRSEIIRRALEEYFMKHLEERKPLD